MSGYDSSSEIHEHRLRIQAWLLRFIETLLNRMIKHDLSKLQSPEKEMFDTWIPHLKKTTFGGPEYNRALLHMGDALSHHYKNNKHHPEHYKNGINDMNLIDLVEMVGDWIVSAGAKQTPVNMDYLSDRFGIDNQLRAIISNTINQNDIWDRKIDIREEET